MKRFYLTTAIDYANGAPHLGHAYEKVLSDVIARYRRMRGDSVHFLTGLDEHGQKVQISAQKHGVEPQDFCDAMAEKYRELCRNLNISHDDYIRTTEERHKSVVRGILTSLYEKGEIYLGEYTGFYSQRAEQFLQEKDKVDGEWPEVFGDVTEITESNYFFKLAKYQDWLISFLEENPDFICPAFRQKQVLEFLKEDLNDLSISRPKERLEWGIPLPFDDSYVTYVWFDALINYISAVGYGKSDFGEFWPADYHVIGKDIMVPAHAIYWLIMLKACNIPLPKHLLVHGFWTSSGAKVSKSAGNAIDPLGYAETYGKDALRYFLIREMRVGQDAEFSDERFLSRYSGELANDFGNLLSRVINMVGRYHDGKIPEPQTDDDLDQKLRSDFESAARKFVICADELDLSVGLEAVFEFLKGINRYAEERAPWKLAKSEDSGDEEVVSTTLANMAEALRLCAELLTPVIPETSEKVLTLLGLDYVRDADKKIEDSPAWNYKLTGKSVGEKTILFPRPEKSE